MNKNYFKEYLLANINAHEGETDRELCELYSIEDKDNKAKWITLAYKMLGITSNREDELKKENIIVKTIRVNSSGKIRENMSFPTISFLKMQKEEWEDSYIYNYFLNTKFLFVVFREYDDSYIYLGSSFWKMSESDLNNIVKKEWLDIQKVLKNGVEFYIDKKCVKNNFPKKSETKIIHIRPKANKAAYKLNCGFESGNIKKDADQLPNGEWMTKQCFWLNNDYILEQLSRMSTNIRNEVESIAIDNIILDSIKEKLTKDFYFIDEVERIFKDTADITDVRYINSYNMKKLGYRFYYSYIVSEKYFTAKEYFEDLLLSKEVIYLNDYDKRVTEIGLFKDTVKLLKYNRKIFECFNGEYVNIKRLEERGINKDEFKDFQEEVIRKSGQNYFTIKSLKLNTLESNLVELGFEDCFYEDILFSSGMFNCIDYKGVQVFKYKGEEFTLIDFIESIVTSVSKIDIYELQDYLENEYGILIEIGRLKRHIGYSKLYYDETMEKVYIDYDEYFKEI